MDSIFYLRNGRVKITVVSQTGKEATIAILTSGDFAGEESLTAANGLRLATATAITSCSALKINREEMIRVMHEEHDFSDLFLKFLLARSMRTQADLVDQLFNSSEKRLARILLLMAAFGKPGEPVEYIPKISRILRGCQMAVCIIQVTRHGRGTRLRVACRKTPPSGPSFIDSCKRNLLAAKPRKPHLRLFSHFFLSTSLPDTRGCSIPACLTPSGSTCVAVYYSVYVEEWRKKMESRSPASA